MKKFIKRIGKGIKRLGKKIGKFVGRIGKKVSELPVLGQIALSIAMPYAAGAIWKGVSSLAGMAGTQFSWATLGTAGKALTGSQNIISKVLGRTMQAISWTAQAPGKAYNFITDMIGTGIDRLKNSEFIQGTKDWMQKTFGVPQLDTADDILKAGQYIPFEDLTEQGLEIISKATPEQMKEISRMGLEEWVAAGDPSTWPTGSLFKSPMETWEETIGIVDEAMTGREGITYKQATTPVGTSPEDIAISEGKVGKKRVAPDDLPWTYEGDAPDAPDAPKPNLLQTAARVAESIQPNEVAENNYSLGTVIDLNLTDPESFSDIFAGIDFTEYLGITGRNGVQSHPYGRGFFGTPYEQALTRGEQTLTRGGVTVMQPQFYSTQPTTP